MIGLSLEESEAIKDLLDTESPISSAIRKYIQFKADRYTKLCNENCRLAMDDEKFLKSARDYAAQARAMAAIFPDLEREIKVLSGPTGQGDE